MSTVPKRVLNVFETFEIESHCLTFVSPLPSVQKDLISVENNLQEFVLENT